MKTKADIMKMAVSAMVAMLVTGAAAWMVFGQDKVTRTEMVDYVAHNSPWVVERGEITASVRGNARNLQKLEQICQRLIDAQQQLVVEQRVLVTRVEALLDRDER
jgi:hypothetical protein